MSNKDDKKVSESLSKLESIAEWFEKQEEIDLEEGLEKVKQGAEIIKELKTKLKGIKNKFEEIKEGLEEDDDEK